MIDVDIGTQTILVCAPDRATHSPIAACCCRPKAIRFSVEASWFRLVPDCRTRFIADAVARPGRRDYNVLVENSYLLIQCVIGIV